MKIVSQKKVTLGSVIGVIFLVALIVTLWGWFGKANPSITTITSKSSLEDIINLSKLSTFEAIYNGVAEVHDINDPASIDYFVSYEAKIKAGFDFEKIDISVNESEKKIIVTLPKITLSDPEVDITSLDFIFRDNSANNSSVSEQAYRAAITDAKMSSLNQTAIYDLAAQNAENVVIALVEPFVQQIDSEYSVEVRQEDQ